MSQQTLQTQNTLLLNNLLEYYNKNNNLEKILKIIIILHYQNILLINIRLFTI